MGVENYFDDGACLGGEEDLEEVDELEADTEGETVDFARKRKPTGNKRERQGPKKPNQIRHDQNAAIAWNTWKNPKSKPK